MQQTSAEKNRLRLIGSALVIGWLSNCLSFCLIASGVALYIDPSGLGSGYALGPIIVLAPVFGILGALISAVVADNVKFSEEINANRKIIVAIKWASVFIGLIASVLTVVLILVWINHQSA